MPCLLAEAAAVVEPFEFVVEAAAAVVVAVDQSATQSPQNTEVSSSSSPHYHYHHRHPTRHFPNLYPPVFFHSETIESTVPPR